MDTDFYYTVHRLGSCQTLYDSVLLHNDVHNHPPSPLEIAAKELMNKAKAEATSSTSTPHQILSSIMVDMPTSLAGSLPSAPQMKRTIQRARNLVHFPSALPTSLHGLTFPDEYKITLRGEEFLKYDSGPSQSRIIMFLTTKP